ncbi:MAG: hypothetical protein ABR986_10555 [Methanomassiliicoccales archaeon]
MSKISDEKGSFAIMVIALIVILIVVLAFAAVLFLPVKAVNFDESKSVSSAAGVNRLNLKLSTDVGEVRVIYTNLSGKALDLHVMAKGSVGFLMDPNTISLDFVQSTSADTALVNASVNVKDRLLGGSNLNLRCDIMIDNSMRSKLDLSTSTGSVTVNSTNASAFDQVSLSARTGAVTLKVASGVSLYGDISLSTNIGASVLDWQDPIVKQNIKVVASTKTGGVELNLNQTTPMDKAVSFNGTTVTGGVSLNLGIRGNVSASINSTTEFGGVHVGSKVGFIGTDKVMTSTNYPSDGNFAVKLRTNVGGVEVNALSVPSNP